MPFVGAGLTGNPKRPFIASKDLLLNVDPTDPVQMRQALSAIKDGFTQVERAISTREVAARFRDGGSRTLTNATQVLPFGNLINVDWDSGNVISKTNNWMTAIESGIYMIVVGISMNIGLGTPASYEFLLQHSASNGTTNIANNPIFVHTPPSQSILPLVQVFALFNASANDRFNVYGLTFVGGAVTDTASISSMTMAKVADVPSRFGV